LKEPGQAPARPGAHGRGRPYGPPAPPREVARRAPDPGRITHGSGWEALRTAHTARCHTHPVPLGGVKGEIPPVVLIDGRWRFDRTSCSICAPARDARPAWRTWEPEVECFKCAVREEERPAAGGLRPAALELAERSSSAPAPTRGGRSRGGPQPVAQRGWGPLRARSPTSDNAAQRLFLEPLLLLLLVLLLLLLITW